MASSASILRDKKGIRRFIFGQCGALSPFLLMIFLLLIVATGVGIDLARHEAARAALQDALDRATLAAAQAPNRAETAAVVIERVQSMHQAPGRVALDLAITDSPTSHRVAAAAQHHLDPIFLSMLGLDRLGVRAESIAVEERPAHEIVLVLDVSSSMRFDGKFDAVQRETVRFVREMLRPGAGARTSITLVPFAGGVNPGPRLFHALGGRRLHPLSSCLVLTSADFDHGGLPSRGTYAQVEAFQDWPRYDRIMGRGTCPSNPRFEYLDPHTGKQIGYVAARRTPNAIERVAAGGSIAFHETDVERIAARLARLQLYHGARVQDGMRWALAALDPSAARMLKRHRRIAGRHDDRPLAWSDPAARKTVIIVTDSAIDREYRPDPRDPALPSLVSAAPAMLVALQRRSGRAAFLDACAIAAAQDIAVFGISLYAPEAMVADLGRCTGRADRVFETRARGLGRAYGHIRGALSTVRLVGGQTESP
ncbi:MAG: pilus assembly protein TadG-related protein [Pseudomonadota bacterium]